jgi:hypothetical protein
MRTLGYTHAAVGSASGITCHTALQFRQWQTAIDFRTVTLTSVEPQIGQTLQVAGMAAQHSRSTPPRRLHVL